MVDQRSVIVRVVRELVHRLRLVRAAIPPDLVDADADPGDANRRERVVSSTGLQRPNVVVRCCQPGRRPSRLKHVLLRDEPVRVVAGRAADLLAVAGRVPEQALLDQGSLSGSFLAAPKVERLQGSVFDLAV